MRILNFPIKTIKKIIFRAQQKRHDFFYVYMNIKGIYIWKWNEGNFVIYEFMIPHNIYRKNG